MIGPKQYAETATRASSFVASLYKLITTILELKSYGANHKSALFHGSDDDDVCLEAEALFEVISGALDILSHFDQNPPVVAEASARTMLLHRNAVHRNSKQGAAADHDTLCTVVQLYREELGVKSRGRAASIAAQSFTVGDESAIVSFNTALGGDSMADVINDLCTQAFA